VGLHLDNLLRLNGLVFLRVVTQRNPVRFFLGQSRTVNDQDQEEDGDHSPDGKEHNHSVHSETSRGSDIVSLRESLIPFPALQTAFHLCAGVRFRVSGVREKTLSRQKVSGVGCQVSGQKLSAVSSRLSAA